MMKKVMAVLLTAAMVTGCLVGCGNSGSGDAAPAPAPAAESKEEAPAPAADTSTSDAPAIDYGSGTIKIWVAEEVVDFTKTICDKFFQENPDMAGYRLRSSLQVRAMQPAI